jgi:hypothetical protein
MGLSMMAILSIIKEKEEALRSGQISLNMKEIGRTIKFGDTENLVILTGIHMKDNGFKIMPMPMGSLKTVIMKSTKDTGRWISNMEKEKKLGETGVHMKETIVTV